MYTFRLPRILICFILLTAFAGCGKQALRQGPWLGVIIPDSTQPAMTVNFNMNLNTDATGTQLIEITNAGEKIAVTEVRLSADSIIFSLPVFSSQVYAVIKGDSMIGKYYPKGKGENRVYRFYALAGVTDRFPKDTIAPVANVSGRWAFTENPGTADQSVDVGEFVQEGSLVKGTILTTTGDYRFLEGKVSGKDFMVSCFDGAHSMIFRAEINPEGNLINGLLIGSPSWKTPWTAMRNDSIQLPPSEKLVWIKEGASTLNFSLPDLNGNMVSPLDERFKGKVLIIQALGSWCPNCMDETRMYNDLYKKYNAQGLEILALSFETSDFEKSKKRMQRFIEQTGAAYTFLWAGETSRDNRAKLLSGIEGQMAYPTTIFVDRKGNMRKVDTGFSGPGTGVYYEKLILQTEEYIQTLLSEK